MAVASFSWGGQKSRCNHRTHVRCLAFAGMDCCNFEHDVLCDYVKFCRVGFTIELTPAQNLSPVTNLSPHWAGVAITAYMSLSFSLDATDWKILRELQRDGRITNVELAGRVGLSPPPCLRRVQALERAGVISGYRALLDAGILGFDVRMFAFVGLKRQADSELKAFESLVTQWPLVREAYAISGEADFLLKCVARDLTALQDFIIRDLTAAANVEHVKTTLILRVSKYEPGVPIP